MMDNFSKEDTDDGNFSPYADVIDKGWMVMVSSNPEYYGLHDYTADCVKFQFVPKKDGENTLDRGERYKKNRQNFISNMSLPAKTGREWLVEALLDFGNELGTLIDDSDRFIEDWEAIKHRIEDIEAVFMQAQ